MMIHSGSSVSIRPRKSFRSPGARASQPFTLSNGPMSVMPYCGATGATRGGEEISITPGTRTPRTS
eukprot:3630047-Pyramimonas_sp.AAC.1